MALTLRNGLDERRCGMTRSRGHAENEPDNVDHCRESGHSSTDFGEKPRALALALDSGALELEVPPNKGPCDPVVDIFRPMNHISEG